MSPGLISILKILLRETGKFKQKEQNNNINHGGPFFFLKEKIIMASLEDRLHSIKISVRAN